MLKQKETFVSKIQMQHTTAYVYIPSNVRDFLSLKKGEWVHVKLSKVSK